LEVQLTARHVDVTEELREYLNEKASRLTRFYDRIHEIEAVVEQESEQIRFEMIVRADRKHTFVASLTGPDTFALIDGVTDKLERQLKDYKEKNRNHKGGLAADGGGEISAP